MGMRKINRVGTSTLTVSLPNKWVNMHNVHAGEEVNVIEEDSRVVISLKNSQPLHKTAHIHLKKGDIFRT